MDIFLGKITQHAMNYAIRSGVGITASFAISQTSRLLKTVDNSADRNALQDLQKRLNSKIRIISPAIDMIELISARGNTTLESAVTLTKELRWDIQSLGTRLSKAASTEEQSRKNRGKAATRAAHENEIRQIIIDIKKLLSRIEDAIPLMNLAITTSGASLSTNLPAGVSPSRMLQASTFITACDTQFSMRRIEPVIVGPAFTLSVYMLYAGHIHRANSDAESMRDTTWKEVAHKARVRLMRIPLHAEAHETAPLVNSIEPPDPEGSMMSGNGRASEFSYHLELIEDLEDDRMHSFEDNELQPGPYNGVALAGIREFVPIHQISKIFYADTGKILNVGAQGETNNPVLLLKRDVNATPPRRMMQESERDEGLQYEDQDDTSPSEEHEESQKDIDRQLRRESSAPIPFSPNTPAPAPEEAWKFPADLDTEWMALEVYTETSDSDSEDEHDQEIASNSAYASHRPSSSHSPFTNLASSVSNLHLSPSPTSPTSSHTLSPDPRYKQHRHIPPTPSPFGQIRSSLSLLEMLIRLTALQQFQQSSHLSIPDELLTFFLEESSTTGTGGDGDERRRTRREARRKVGFDPYDESPVKRHGEEYQYAHAGESEHESSAGNGNRYGSHSRTGTPYEIERGYRSPGWGQGSRDGSVGISMRSSPSPLSPATPYRPAVRKGTGPLDRVKQERGTTRAEVSALGRNSPLRGASSETDSTLGTSPGSPQLANRIEKDAGGNGKG
ncbi:RanGTP-binding protein-domain-containing protein [Calycina marina]|uniref:RanGTP-binding protein-domain-containing protein n=1 Tax=Calycina marina TaxID=1763456 RepID=A0A9P7YZ47_9HELO|nr:RanGTP-binding protein-domain-containing protein [Calycina marina]